MKNEALRILLAVTALILTALLTNPIAQTDQQHEQNRRIAVEKSIEIHKKDIQKEAQRSKKTKKSKSSRSYAFFWRR